MSYNFAELLEESSIGDVRPGSVIQGEVKDIMQKMVAVDVRLKSEGMVPIEQFTDSQGELEVKVGDKVDVVLEVMENGYGQVRLSREKAKLNVCWQKIERAYTDGESVIGRMVDKVKGGYVVSLEGIRAFLPGSLLDAGLANQQGVGPGPVAGSDNCRALLQEIGEMEFHIIKFNKKQNNVVVSRRSIGNLGKSQDELLEELEEGKAIEGIVKNLAEYGAFVDIGGVDGLLHVTDMAWRRVRNPSEVVSIGDKVEVKILKVDRERKRISLGMKQLREDPWVSLVSRYPSGKAFSGKVTNILDYGCFVELEEGVEGLVHVSEMDWVRKNVHPSKLVEVGKQVEIKVLDINEDKRRISLSMKQCLPNPWEQFEAANEKGSKVKGSLKALTEFGLFFGLENGIDGLVHISDLSWDESNNEQLLRSYESRRGEEMELVFLGIDPSRERISLGIKQLTEDNFVQWCGANPKGAKVECTVTGVETASVKVAIDNEGSAINGAISVGELSLDEKIDDARTAVSAGDRLTAAITGFDKRKRLVQLSVRALESAEQKQAVREYSAASDAEGSTKLGEVMSEQLAKQPADAPKADE